eukprot:TRINITY_DN4771_c0_g1_i19.p1 TRINITY_DN4771_c0_g1~~TRINITY_DN4771_c0_g1_i19.p1  ORF type:complete len:615 (+),score=133.57 TRINITY_DN4771_c0_g1_i19:141-1847(+)
MSTPASASLSASTTPTHAQSRSLHPLDWLLSSQADLTVTSDDFATDPWAFFGMKRNVFVDQSRVFASAVHDGPFLSYNTDSHNKSNIDDENVANITMDSIPHDEAMLDIDIDGNGDGDGDIDSVESVRVDRFVHASHDGREIKTISMGHHTNAYSHPIEMEKIGSKPPTSSSSKAKPKVSSPKAWISETNDVNSHSPSIKSPQHQENSPQSYASLGSSHARPPLGRGAVSTQSPKALPHGQAISEAPIDDLQALLLLKSLVLSQVDDSLQSAKQKTSQDTDFCMSIPNQVMAMRIKAAAKLAVQSEGACNFTDEDIDRHILQDFHSKNPNIATHISRAQSLPPKHPRQSNAEKQSSFDTNMRPSYSQSSEKPPLSRPSSARNQSPRAPHQQSPVPHLSSSLTRSTSSEKLSARSNGLHEMNHSTPSKPLLSSSRSSTPTRAASPAPRIGLSASVKTTPSSIVHRVSAPSPTSLRATVGATHSLTPRTAASPSRVSDQSNVDLKKSIRSPSPASKLPSKSTTITAARPKTPSSVNPAESRKPKSKIYTQIVSCNHLPSSLSHTAYSFAS